jgi:hypothetical protein
VTSVVRQSRRFCDVCFSVRYPIPDILTSVGTGPPVAFPPKLQITGATAAASDDGVNCFGGVYRQQRTGTSTAPNQHGIYPWDALPDFCLIAIYRRTAQDWRGADDRPLDSRIKGARCAAVGRVSVHRLIATFQAQAHLARIQVLLCAQEVGAMSLVLPRHQCLSRRCRTSRPSSRLARCATGSAG